MLKPKHMQALFMLLALLVGGQGHASPARLWTVIYSSRLDVRLRTEISALAAGEGATVRFIAAEDETPEAASTSRGVVIRLDESVDPATWTPQMDREGFQLLATFGAEGRPFFFRIGARTPSGFHHGLRRCRDLVRVQVSDFDGLGSKLSPPPQNLTVTRTPTTTTVFIADFPSFPERGIVEGFYGKPWSHQDRLDMLRFEGAHGMNVYYYAPKDDLYHRHWWRKPYPKREAARLAELAKTAKENFVEFCFAISPGLSIRYSSEEDFRQLSAKLAQVSDLGISCFALFLDDVPPELQDEADRAQFKTLAQAHASLINKLYDDLKSRSPRNRLVVTPTTYTTSWGRRDYIADLGGLVRSEIPLVWTGIDTFSPQITREQAVEWSRLIRRPPLIWDNFPVNDADPWRPHLGPLAGRSADLPEVTQGFFANPMVQPQLSKIPLATVADYLWRRRRCPAPTISRYLPRLPLGRQSFRAAFLLASLSDGH
jgi:hypothetical protein